MRCPLLVGVAVAAIVATAAGEVAVLTKDNFKPLVLDATSGVGWIVDFYAPWCTIGGAGVVCARLMYSGQAGTARSWSPSWTRPPPSYVARPRSSSAKWIARSRRTSPKNTYVVDANWIGRAFRP